MTKKSWQNLNILRTKRAFKINKKPFSSILKGFQWNIKHIFSEGESPTLSIGVNRNCWYWKFLGIQKQNRFADVSFGLLFDSYSTLNSENINSFLLIWTSARPVSKGCSVYLAVWYHFELTRSALVIPRNFLV